MHLLCFALWLDLRGKPCTQDLDSLLTLYTGVRNRLDAAGLPPPSGAAVAGILHLTSDDEEDDGDDGGLSLLSIDEAGSVWMDGCRAGSSIVAGKHIASTVTSLDNTYIAMLGKESLPMFETALSDANERIMSGGVPYMLVECCDAAGISALAQLEQSDAVCEQLPLGAVLAPDEGLWFEAMKTAGSGATAAAPDLPETPLAPRANEGVGGQGVTSSVKKQKRSTGEGGASKGREEPPSRRAKRRARGGGRTAHMIAPSDQAPARGEPGYKRARARAALRRLFGRGQADD